MKFKDNTILITGGSSGIGVALAQRFAVSGNVVVITGRRLSALQKVKDAVPGLHFIESDVGVAEQRVALCERVLAEFPSLNVVINNAGIQHRVDLTCATEWNELVAEIDVNLCGPVHLATLFVPHLLRQDTPRIINVSSGLAFVPLAHMPVYCATKAAIHSFSQSLRFQLRETPIKVIEVIPPAVKTNLGGAHTFGEDLEVFVGAIMQQILDDAPEATFSTSSRLSRASRNELDQMFAAMNGGNLQDQS